MSKSYSISELALEFGVTPPQAIGLTREGSRSNPCAPPGRDLERLKQFRRFDDSFAFDAYRRDGLANRDCLPFACFGSRILDRETEALREARSRLTWLNRAMQGAL